MNQNRKEPPHISSHDKGGCNSDICRSSRQMGLRLLRNSYSKLIAKSCWLRSGITTITTWLTIKHLKDQKNEKATNRIISTNTSKQEGILNNHTHSRDKVLVNLSVTNWTQACSSVEQIVTDLKIDSKFGGYFSCASTETDYWADTREWGCEPQEM